jgi:beta-glucanase (GH16 family)
MFHSIISFIFFVVFVDISLAVGWNPSNFSFNPGDNYELVWQDEFENVGPAKAIINGQPAYAPNPKNWAHRVGPNLAGGMQYCTNSIQNAHVQNDQLKIVAIKEGYTSAMLHSQFLQEFTFGVFAAKICLPYGLGMWPAWWLEGNGVQYGLQWPTFGEIDILEMYGGNSMANYTDAYAHGTVHWNNQSNTMNPVHDKYLETVWGTPDGSMLHNNSLVYWTEWTSTKIKIGVNEFVFSQINTTNLPESINPVWAFSGAWPYYMILNISIRGQKPGPPDNTTIWPQEMVVDWVRVYQRN